MKKILRYLSGTAFVMLLLCALSFCTSAADFTAPEFKEILAYESSIKLTWDKIEGADGYHIQKKDADGKFRHVVNTVRDNWTVRELASDTKYEFRIRAYSLREDKTKDYGTFSKSYFKKTRLPIPQNLTCETADETSITLKWDSAEGAAHYNVYYCIPGKTGYKLAGSPTETFFKIEGLSTTDRYRFKLCAKSASNTSLYSDTILFFTSPGKGQTPAVKSYDRNRITINWNKTGYENAYNVYISTSENGSYQKLETIKKRYYTYEGEPGKTYFFRIQPVISTAKQFTEGSLSDPLKAQSRSMTIKAPSVIRKGDYPDITVPYYNSYVTWTSSDKSVITLKNGRLFAAGKGSATLTATYKNQKVQLKLTVSSPAVSVLSAVYDHTNDQYIFEQGINSRCYPASITKLITALTALEYMDPYDTIVVGSELNMVESNSSTCGLRKGEKFRLKDILYGLLVPSGGDAAYTIAVNCARKVSGDPNMGYVKAKDYFAGLMNKYMKSIGATGTNCVNPHGYPKSNHYSTVHDLMLVANKVLENELLKTITSTKQKTITSLTGRTYNWRTTNSLMKSSSGYYHPNAHGMKTGTVNSGYTGIIAVATKNGRTIITIVIGCPSYNARYDNTHKLLKAYL